MQFQDSQLTNAIIAINKKVVDFLNEHIYLFHAKLVATTDYA